MQKEKNNSSSKRPEKKATTPFLKKKIKKKFIAKKSVKIEAEGVAPELKKVKKASGIPFKPKGKKKQNAALAGAAQKLFNKKVKTLKPQPKPDIEIYTEEETFPDEIRLNKYLSHAGIASRRKADELIKEGKVKVNGTVVVEMGYKVKIKDRIEFDGKMLSLEKKYYLLLNKPKDFITTVRDERDRKTVMDLIRGAFSQMKSQVKPRLYPVGRLDRNTTGVL